MNKGKEFRPQRITSGLVGMELMKTVKPGEVVTKQSVGRALAELNMGSESNTRNYANALVANGVIERNGMLNYDALRPKTIEITIPGMYIEDVKFRVKEMIYRYGDMARINVVE